MALTKTVKIDDKEVTFRASAAVPRIYRIKFRRDIYKDLDALQKAIDTSSEEASTLDSFSLELFENIAYVMAKLLTRTSRTARKNGSMSSTPFPFTRCSRRSLTCGG